MSQSASNRPALTWIVCWAVTVISCLGEKSCLAAERDLVIQEPKITHGWTLHLSRALLDQHPQPTARAVELLGKQLEEIQRVVPPVAVAQLQKVPLYFNREYPEVPPRAEYHPNVQWLRENSRNPAMAKSVEFTNIASFEPEMSRMPNFALHELAHAYHDRVLPLGFDNREIKSAFDRARKSGSYERVERHHGAGQARTFERSYAMTNPMEYFAECSEAYFVRNDFFPFTREELQRHDPQMYALIERLWKVRTP